jgi:hypothetical protein
MALIDREPFSVPGKEHAELFCGIVDERQADCRDIRTPPRGCYHAIAFTMLNSVNCNHSSQLSISFELTGRRTA